MLHEILLSLSGHHSPLLAATSSNTNALLILSPSEKALLASIAHLSDLNCKLIASASQIASTHPSSICQAVALSITSAHLAKFQQKVLEVELGILRKDAGIVGAYNIVPLTALVGEFSEWTRRMEWFWEIAQFMMQKGCTGARILNRLFDSIQTGYSDVEEVALHLLKVAETAWLKQASAWILYGRLPFSGRIDFFVQQGEDDDMQYMIQENLLPEFVSSLTAASILFIGRSLNHIRVKGMASSNSSLGLVPSHLQLISTLPSPITSTSLSSVISAVRLSLSQHALEKLLPLSRISEILSLLHEFFLLGRGEFALTLISEADEKIRSRWRRSDNLAYDQKERLSDVVVKDSEVSAILVRTWAALSSIQGMNDDDDEQLDLARDLVQLSIVKSSSIATPPRSTSSTASQPTRSIAHLPFNNLLLSVPTQLSLQIPSPLDLFLSPSEVQTYSSINAYLLSIRRAHLRLADLWKITSLRRHHPAPPAPPYGSTIAGRAVVQKLRARTMERGGKIRAVWATSSAALFLLGETESYLHGEIVKGTWADFQRWVTGTPSRPNSGVSGKDQADVWETAGKHPQHPMKSQAPPTHDPQTLSEAHKKFLDCLTQDLLLTSTSFTDPLYKLLQQIDHLVALVYRIHSIWQSLDLEADEGVVDAFSDFHKEESYIEEQLAAIASQVKYGIEVLIRSLRDIDQEKDDRYDNGLENMFDGTAYRPQRRGRVDRLLMKLDFGGWFDTLKTVDENHDDDSIDDLLDS